MASETPSSAAPPAAVSIPGVRTGPRWRIPGLACAVALALAHFAWLMAHFAPATMSPDANGYIVQARLIATEGRTSFTVASPVQFVGMHWLETQDGVFRSRYPAGLPGLMAAAWKIGGPTAALLVNPVLASATVLLVFLLARGLMGERFALLAAALVATIPVTNQHALDADAHIAATFFLVAGVLALRHFAADAGVGARSGGIGANLPPEGGTTNEGNAVGHAAGYSVARGFAAGLLLGIVPTIRYPEAIVGLTVAAWLAWRIRPWWRAWPAVAGAAVPLIALGVHNAGAYGAFWRTGYALTNEQTGFGLGFFLDHAVPYLLALSGNGLGLCFAFGAAGLAALVADRRWRAEGVLFAGIVVPLVLLYMAYYFGGGPAGGSGALAGNLRFLIPTFPFFAIAAAWLLSRCVGHFGPAGRAAAVVVALLQFVVTLPPAQQVLARTHATLRAAAGAQVAAEKQAPAGSILIVDRTLAESIDGTGAWRLVEESLVGGAGPRLGPGMGPGPGLRPLGGGRPTGIDSERPSPQQPGKNRAQRERYAELGPAERRARVWADLAAWSDGRPVYWFTRSLDAVENALPPDAYYEKLAEVEAPAMGFGPPGGGPMPKGGGPGGRGGPRGGRFDPTQFNGPPRGGPGIAPGRFGGPPNDAAEPGAKLRLVKITLPKS